MSASPTTLRVERLTVRYGGRMALSDVSLEAGPGELIALTGPNGSGKSTLLRAVMGLLVPDAGTIRIEGADVAELTLKERARRIAWAPQEEPVGENVSILEYVRFGRHPHLEPFGVEGPADDAAVERALRRVDFWEGRNRGVQELSGGERQRVRLGRVLAQETPLLMLDEPTAFLDIGHQLEALERVRTIAQSERRCALVALHDLNLAARFADRIVVLSRGRLVATGTPREVLSPELLADVWGIVADLRWDPTTSLPYLLPVLPLDRRAPGGPPGRRWMARVHVVAGGGSGAELIPRLAQEGFEISVGAVHLFDSDAELGQRLGVAMATETPFTPISSRVIEHLEELLEACDAVVVAPVPTGPANLANWTALREWAGRRPMALLPLPSELPWDFTGGAAARLREEILRGGGEEVPTVDRLVAWLRERVPAEALHPRLP